VTEFHGFFVVVWCGVDTAHHTLIITEEEDGQASNTIDGNEKATLLQLVDDIGSWDEIHGGEYLEWGVIFERWSQTWRECCVPLGFGEAGQRRSKRGSAWLKSFAVDGRGFLYERYQASKNNVPQWGVMWRSETWAGDETRLVPNRWTKSGVQVAVCVGVNWWRQSMYVLSGALRRRCSNARVACYPFLGKGSSAAAGRSHTFGMHMIIGLAQV
jgi:hypothetical protein